eukprot:scaffold430028_cov37-Prasinocladus_malaysianus.AAC.1
MKLKHYICTNFESWRVSKALICMCHTYVQALHVQGLACIEPPPRGLGPCGGRFGRRITTAGVPSSRFGGPKWGQIGRLVTAISNDKR